jgi:AraC family transcriptional regulator
MDLSSLHDLSASNDPTEVLAYCPASVAGFPISVMPIPATGELSDDHHHTSRIFVAQAGRGRRWYRNGRFTRAMHTAPRMIEIYQAGLVFDHARWDGEAGRCILIEFSDSDVERMTHGQMRSLRLQTRHEVFDDRVSRLTLEIANESLSGLPNGDLYVQGLCVALAGALGTRYGAGFEKHDQVAQRSLSPAQQRRLADLFQQLGSKLSLENMAREVGLSVYHFARLFKTTYGAPPHQYVQRLRIDAAVEALRQKSDTPIAQIALAFGFASQSHMTELMRRHMGFTPKTLRRASTEKP